MMRQYSNEFDSNAYFDFLKYVREQYVMHWTGSERQDPYKFGFQYGGMTPIEKNVWNTIRGYGLELYPQFPVGKYYLDFANPFLKVAIEVDGKEHLDPERIAKDAKRTYELSLAGWEIVRIPGWITFKRNGELCRCQREECQMCVADFERPTLDALMLDLRDDWHLHRSRTYSSEECRLMTTEEIMKLVEEDRKLLPRKRKANEILFGLKIPGVDADYKHTKIT